MKYKKSFIFSLSLSMFFSAVVLAQQPAKVKRPAKNPPQYPNIIDLENKDAAQNPQQNPGAQEQSSAQPPDAQTQALAAIAGEVRMLVQELRALNLRQQAQLDVLRMTRIDMRIDHYERELRPVRDRIAELETEEQNLYQSMTPQSLLAQTANMGTINRDQAMLQIKSSYETRLRLVQAEKERLRKVESDLISSIGVYQNIGSETEKRIQATEEMLRQAQVNKESNKVERKQ